MKSIRKLSIFSVLFFISFVLFSVQTFGADPEGAVTTDGITYYVEETQDDYDLGYGVQYTRDKAYTRVNESGVMSGQISGSGKGGDIEIGTFYSQQINMLTFNTSEELKIVPYAVLKNSKWQLSRIVLAAQEYEKEHPGYKVIGGINGDFFNTSEPFGSTGVTVGDGEYYSSYNGHPTIAIKNDGSVNQLFTLSDRSMNYTITFYDNDNNQIYKTNINNVNSEPGDNEISLYFLQRKSSSELSYWSTQEVNNAWVVKNASKAVTVKIDSFYGKGNISEFVSGTYTFTGGNSEFAIKSNNSEVNEYLKEGVLVRVQKEYTSSEASGVQNFIGSQSQFIVNGEFKNSESNVTQTKTRCPRTIIGLKADGTVMMIVIDGRQYKAGYHGMGSCELSALCKYYNLVNAWNLDGGGSSTLIIRKQETFTPTQVFNEDATSNWWVTNSPSDGGERSDANCLLLVAKVPEVKIEAESKTSSSISLVVTNISELGKYKELYIYYNKKFEEIKDGKLNVTNLNASKNYIFPIYAKVNDKYVYMFSKFVEKTALEMASIRAVNYNVTLKDEETSYQFGVAFNNNDCIKTTKLIINDKVYDIKTNNITLDENEVNLLLTNNYKIIITYDLEDLTGEHSMEFNNLELNVKSSIIVFDAIRQKTDEIISSIIK